MNAMKKEYGSKKKKRRAEFEAQKKISKLQNTAGENGSESH